MREYGVHQSEEIRSGTLTNTQLLWRDRFPQADAVRECQVLIYGEQEHAAEAP
jgi:hypothetical protein